jgi:hypothetical protein
MSGEAQAPETPPAFEVKEGKVFIDGIDVTEVARPGEDDATEEAPKDEPNKDNATVEGDEPEPEEKKEPTEEPKEAAKAPEPEPEKEPEKPKEPEKLTFKLKFRGKEEEVAYEPSQIQVRLNKLRAFEENEKEFWEKSKEVGPYAEVVKSDWFKAKLAEAYESGELTRPAEPEPPPASVQYEVVKRQADPDHGDVMEALRDYARNLPPEAVRILDSDATVFLSEYDRVAKEVREKKAKPEPEKKEAKPDPKDVAAKLALKESAKSRATVAQPGTMGDPPDPNRAVQKRLKELERLMRDPSQASRNLEYAAEMIALRQQRQPT